MKPRQIPWKWLLLGLITLLIAGLMLLPRLLTDSTQLASRVTDALSTWTGGDVKLTGPLRVHYFPDVSIKSGFELTNATRLPLVKSIGAKDAKVSIDLVELMSNRVRIDALRLLKLITLRRPRSSWAPTRQYRPGGQRAEGRADRRASPTRRYHYLRQRVWKRSKIDALRQARHRAMSSFGSFSHSAMKQLALRSLRRLPKRRTGFAFRSISPSPQPLAAKVTGTASFVNGLQLDGEVRADMDDAALLQMGGIAFRRGGVQKLSAVGTAHWNGSTLTFDDGTFSLDGNKAVGLLAVTPGPRPRIDATLDFERLAIDPYLGGAEAPAPPAAQAAVLEGALIKYFDADLRISAAEVTAPMIKLGRGGFTISTKNGVLASGLATRALWRRGLGQRRHRHVARGGEGQRHGEPRRYAG
jgi:hypothetical protein